MQQQLSEKCLFDAFGSHNYVKILFQYAKNAIEALASARKD